VPNAKTDIPPANPSAPSMKLKRFVTHTIANTASTATKSGRLTGPASSHAAATAVCSGSRTTIGRLIRSSA
jgi:hypothetical protein